MVNVWVVNVLQSYERLNVTMVALQEALYVPTQEELLPRCSLSGKTRTLWLPANISLLITVSIQFYVLRLVLPM